MLLCTFGNIFIRTEIDKLLYNLPSKLLSYFRTIFPYVLNLRRTFEDNNSISGSIDVYLRSYFRTSVLPHLRRYFRTFVRKYESTFVLRTEVWYESTFESTFVLSKVRKYFRTSVDPYCTVHMKVLSKVRKYFRTFVQDLSKK